MFYVWKIISTASKSIYPWSVEFLSLDVFQNSETLLTVPHTSYTVNVLDNAFENKENNNNIEL